MDGIATVGGDDGVEIDARAGEEAPVEDCRIAGHMAVREGLLDAIGRDVDQAGALEAGHQRGIQGTLRQRALQGIGGGEGRAADHVDDIGCAEQVAIEYDQDPDVVEEDFVTFCSDLLERGLVEVAADDAGPA